MVPIKSATATDAGNPGHDRSVCARAALSGGFGGWTLRQLQGLWPLYFPPILGFHGVCTMGLGACELAGLAWVMRPTLPSDKSTFSMDDPAWWLQPGANALDNAGALRARNLG